MPVRHTHIALSAEVWAPQHVFNGLPPMESVSAGVANQVIRYTREEGLDHYPALEHLFRVGLFSARQVSTLQAFFARSEDFVRTQAVRRLRGPFVDVRCDRSQAVARNLPRVLPGRDDSEARLLEHYAFNHVRLMLIASSPTRGLTAEMENHAAQKAGRWLRNCCMEAQICRSQSLG
ncbi:MAG: hypothetical protein ACPGUC_07910 [Gammaproteobacteria bacterium]